MAELVTSLEPEHGSAFDCVFANAYLFFTIVLGVYHMPGTILAFWDILMYKKSQTFLSLKNLYFSRNRK